MNDFSITTNKEFQAELDFCIDLLRKKELTQGLIEILNRLSEIFDIVRNGKIMIYYQVGYSFLRPFEDCYQDAIDFFKTAEGERVKQVFLYFAYHYKVPESQLGGQCRLVKKI